MPCLALALALTLLADRFYAVTALLLLQDKWTVELLLERIATAESPRFNALIDTGALITGYSNEEVAKQLLERGLAWCDGVVFLDDDDKQQVGEGGANGAVYFMPASHFNSFVLSFTSPVSTVWAR